jgi:hypothetical protein
MRQDLERLKIKIIQREQNIKELAATHRDLFIDKNMLQLSFIATLGGSMVSKSPFPRKSSINESHNSQPCMLSQETRGLNELADDYRMHGIEEDSFPIETEINHSLKNNNSIGNNYLHA